MSKVQTKPSPLFFCFYLFFCIIVFCSSASALSFFKSSHFEETEKVIDSQIIKVTTIKMSMPSYQQQPPPVSYDGVSGHDSSVGPLVGVLVVVIVLGVIAVMIGRLCSGRRIMGYGQYDIESWAERKCSTCIDGRIKHSSSLPLPTRTSESNTSVPATPIHSASQETNKQPQQSSQNSPPN